MMSLGEQITPENVSGLVVGEGCFYVESSADAKYRLGWRLRPAFCIEMRNDDVEILEAVKAHLGCGRIYHLDFGRYRSYASKGWFPHAKYRVTALGDLRDRVLPFFETYPLFGRKRVAFQIFRDLVQLLYEKRHLTPRGLAEGKLIASRLIEHNARGAAANARRNASAGSD